MAKVGDITLTLKVTTPKLFGIRKYIAALLIFILEVVVGRIIVEFVDEKGKVHKRIHKSDFKEIGDGKDKSINGNQ